MDHDQSRVLDFWFRELTPDHWFRGGADLDEKIRLQFGGLLNDAAKGKCDGWATTALGRLALILLLDQFSRHVFRGSPDSYRCDEKAQRLTLEGINSGMDKQLAFSERHFFYLPLMHAESKALQALSIEKFTELRQYADTVFEFAKGHQATVERFGRFPHRNIVLGRTSTDEESAFLKGNH